jgi:4-hydroxy-3-methylbut-2-enyl diphosphate reductase
VGDKLRSDFLDAGYQIVDATCPVVKRNLLHIARYAVTHTILVVGHYKHPESTAMQEVLLDGKPITSRLITTLEDVGEPMEGVSYAVFVQTTFDQSLWMQIQAALTSWQQKGIEVVFANDVCPSSVNRRTALSELAGQCDAVLVIGGKDSANTKALYSMVLEMGKKAWHIEEAAEITNEMRQCAILGITAGASTPASLVESIVDALQQE